LSQLRIQQHLSSPQNFHATGVVERLARTLKTIAAKFGPQDLTATALIRAVQAYNRTPHTALQETPFAAFFGVPAPLPIDCTFPSICQDPLPADQVRDNQHRYATFWASRVNRRRPRLVPGSRVMFHPRRPTAHAHSATRHLQQRAHGPFNVVKSLPFNRFLVSNSVGVYVLPSSQLRPISSPFSPGGES
jgi:hypothetical protein